jgi:hypothetical protein
MQVRLIPVLTLLLVLGGNLAATMHAEDARSISTQEACKKMKTLLPLEQRVWGPGFAIFGTKITGTVLTQAGFSLNLDRKRDISVAYADVKMKDLKDDLADEVAFDLPGRQMQLTGSREIRDQLFLALSSLTEAAHAGRICDCTRDVAQTKAELDTFAQQIAPWRAMSTKPAPSDEVIKKRLLAEDAIEHKNLRAAALYYDAGIALDQTWAQGWYNAALLYAEQQDYFDAAVRMNHYLILLPEAPDAATAKEKLLLWEAKAEEASSN